MSEQQRDDRRACPPFRGGCRAKPWGGRGGARRCRVVGAERPGLGECDGRGAFSGRQGGCVVAVELGDVVTHHD